jgi:hypothetical protein
MREEASFGRLKINLPAGVRFWRSGVSQCHSNQTTTASWSKEASHMRRMIVTAVAAMALAVPGAAIASHQNEHEGTHDQGQHHKRHHVRRQHRSHLVTFGAAASSTPPAPTGTGSPAPVASSSDETAGTVASFSGATLTIALSDGSTVSGKVDSTTEIECRSTMAIASRHGDQGDDNDQGDDRGHDGQSNSGPGDGRQGADDGRDNDDQDEAEHCTTAALVPGAVVREAELSVSNAGGVWEKVELDR